MSILFYTLAVLIWGTDAAITKRFLFSTIGPIPMVTVRLGVAALALLPLALREYPRLRGFGRKQWALLAVLVAVGTLGMNILFYEGLTRTPAFITLILFRLEPVFVILIGALFLKQHTRASTILLTLGAIASGALVSLGGSGVMHLSGLTPLGIGLVLGASICSAIGTIVAKDLLALVSPLLLTSLRTGLSTVLLLAWMGRTLLGETLPGMPAKDILVLVIMGVIYSGLAFWLYYKGLQNTSPLVGSLIQLLRIVSGLLASFVLLAEAPSALQWVGTAGLMATLFLLTRPEKAQKNAAEVGPTASQPG